MAKKPYLVCPKCEHKIDVVAQFKEWVEMYGEESGGEAFINLYCDNCQEGGFAINIEPYGEVESIHSPALDQEVKMPKLK